MNQQRLFLITIFVWFCSVMVWRCVSKNDFLNTWSKRCSELTGNTTTIVSKSAEYSRTNGNKQQEYKIGILIPATTRRVKNPVFEKLSLTAICLPSIYKTMERNYSYYIYIGINFGDYLQSVQERLKHEFIKVKTYLVSGETFMQTVNAIARKAYEDGVDFLVRVNDDTSFETKNWTSQATKIIQNFKPRNVGVVGPTCHEGNTKIMTHDMVHRTHLDIFDFYYPPYFNNWYVDDWITQVYKPHRSKKLTSWIVKHHMKYHKTRYTVNRKKRSRLDITLKFDRERLNEYLSNLKH